MPFWSKKQPQVAPVDKNVLLDRLLALNNPSNPFEITRSDETDLLVQERIVDAKWREGELGMTEKQLKKGYRGWLLLDAASHEARLCDEMTTEQKEKKGPFGLGGMSSQKTTFKGKMMAGKQAGSSGSLSIFGAKKDYEYSFDVKKVHDPIKSTVEDNGWQFKLVATKGAATYSK
jgi:hypothetical protein